MNIDGHNLYRLNYPLRLNKWYHSCQSWNGRTGEWQIWVNDERVGRGFHNRVSWATVIALQFIFFIKAEVQAYLRVCWIAILRFIVFGIL